jgi:exodeoxyribonuclease-3
LKIVTWNVNGLRALLAKTAWEQLQLLEADVICLQEIKTRPDQLSEQQHQFSNGYHASWNSAQKPGYSGVLTLARENPIELDYGIGVDEFDSEGRVIRSRYPDFYLYNIYFPNGQRGQERVDYKLAFYARLLELCDQLHAQNDKIIICGDFNTAHREIDLKIPKENVKTSGFLPEERAWLDIYLQHGFVDAFRQLYPNKIQYTWWTYRLNARQRGIGWRLDFFMVSESLMNQVNEVIIHEDIYGSDHCPVSIDLDV